MRDMPRWRRHGDASSLSTRNVRATFREDAGQIWIAPLETPPVTAVRQITELLQQVDLESVLEIAGTIVVRDEGGEARQSVV